MKRNTWDAGKAFLAVAGRVTDSPAYQDLEARVQRYAVESWLACNSVEDFKAAGGRSAMFAAALERACSEVEDADANMGSSMFKMTPRSVLQLRAPDLNQACRLEEMRSRQAKKQESA